MTFVDANYFLRYLVRPTTLETAAMHARATVLFEAVERGEEDITTSEAVLADVAYLLASKHHYNVPSADVAAYLTPILRLRHFRLPRGQKRLYLRALELWAASPALGFVDALTAATLERTGMVLATFDTDFDRLPGITRWQPPSEGEAS